MPRGYAGYWPGRAAVGILHRGNCCHEARWGGGLPAQWRAGDDGGRRQTAGSVPASAMATLLQASVVQIRESRCCSHQFRTCEVDGMRRVLLNGCVVAFALQACSSAESDHAGSVVATGGNSFVSGGSAGDAFRRSGGHRSRRSALRPPRLRWRRGQWPPPDSGFGWHRAHARRWRRPTEATHRHGELPDVHERGHRADPKKELCERLDAGRHLHRPGREEQTRPGRAADSLLSRDRWAAERGPSGLRRSEHRGGDVERRGGRVVHDHRVPFVHHHRRSSSGGSRTSTSRTPSFRAPSSKPRSTRVTSMRSAGAPARCTQPGWAWRARTTWRV